MGGNTAQFEGSAPIGIQLRHLRYFLAVLEELHFGRAAKRLHISQPPLSLAIRALEEELGVRLFERSSQGVTPTDAGLVFGEETRKVLASVDLAVAEARQAAGLSLALRVGCTPHFPVARVQLFLTALQERIPTAHTEVVHLLCVEQARRLRSGELDVGIVQTAGREAGLEMEPIFPGELLELFFSAHHRLAGRDVVVAEDLRDEVLCLLPRTVQPALHDAILKLLADAGFEFKDVQDIGGTDPRDLILAVATEGGVTVAPEWFRPEGADEAAVVVRPLEPAVHSPDVAVAWRADAPARLRKTVSAAREVAQELYATWLPAIR